MALVINMTTIPEELGSILVPSGGVSLKVEKVVANGVTVWRGYQEFYSDGYTQWAEKISTSTINVLFTSHIVARHTPLDLTVIKEGGFIYKRGAYVKSVKGVNLYKLIRGKE